MKRPDNNGSDHRAISHLISLPRKMLQFHDEEHLAQYLLYDLAKESCLNLHKAAYFVDNPDFDCLRGVAGYCRVESPAWPEDFWQATDLASAIVSSSAFNNQVRTLVRASHKRGTLADEHLVEEVAEKLGLDQPHFCMWDMKHDNHGILMYQYADSNNAPTKGCVLSGVCLLSFCPIA